MSEAMHEPGLPPLPSARERGLQVCETIQLYLAILDDLSFEQAQAVLEHVYDCPACLQTYRLLSQVTQLLRKLEQTGPSSRVDRAVYQAIAARWGPPVTTTREMKEGGFREQADVSRAQPRLMAPPPPVRRSTVRRRLFLLPAVAALVLLVLGASIGLSTVWHPSQAFALPTGLSWSGYVLYHRQTRMSDEGLPYRVETYHNLGTGELHVEATMPGQLDVVLISDGKTVLGLDMMHHVMQWNPAQWNVQDTAFDLGLLRRDLQQGSAHYLGRGRFQGQTVYRIWLPSNYILLLDQRYRPVNLLYAEGAQQGQPVYDSLRLLAEDQVSERLWDMRPPADFLPGRLPAAP
ncbi:anti-sigma factor [Thermogemmatispora tikiterensis]|uniref:Zinc-finger domain-containing protein n=1 Tax=Thermogemmatispora tikiterensis TaxID=1825093 RepID=A0A328VPU9_9CHLR|nr:zf-HC2 domain-containing protein [Thermogemmatispora tikiterensis]RAQ96165.1 hypothetical protein A4R35_11530 [Thermogemmatispora tikiterensis]